LYFSVARIVGFNLDVFVWAESDGGGEWVYGQEPIVGMGEREDGVYD
jgi:hypothetical protein